MKKFLAGLFTMALVLSLATGAFAQETVNACPYPGQSGGCDTQH